LFVVCSMVVEPSVHVVWPHVIWPHTWCCPRNWHLDTGCQSNTIDQLLWEKQKHPPPPILRLRSSSIQSSNHSSIHPTIHPSIQPFICPSFHPSIYPFIQNGRLIGLSMMELRKTHPPSLPPLFPTQSFFFIPFVGLAYQRQGFCV
jgi:hypothetical protein